MGEKLKPLTKQIMLIGLIILTCFCLWKCPERGFEMALMVVTGFFTLLKGDS